MDIEELIDSLRAYAADRHTRPPMEEVLTQAADAIEQFGKKVSEWQEEACKWNNEYFALRDSVPRWISVKERLPEKRKWVLCLCEADIIDVLRWENNEWYHDPMHVYYPSFVSHWQTLPTPPEEDEA